MKKNPFVPISELGYRYSLDQKRSGYFNRELKERGIQKKCESCAFDCVVLRASQPGGSSFECFKFLKRIGE